MYLSLLLSIFVNVVMVKRVITILIILAGSLCTSDTAFAAQVWQQNMVENPTTVVGDDGYMTIDNYGNDKELAFSIYSITGQVVKSGHVAAGTSTTVNLPKGFYIVKCDYWSRKVVVK